MAGEARSYQLSGFAVPSELGAVHALLSQAAADHPELDRTDLMLFETALIEIANNVVEHAQPAGRVRWWFTLRVGADRIEAELQDSGLEFTAPQRPQMPGELAETGRGLALAAAALDDVRLERRGNANHWSMSRSLTPVVAPGP